MALPVTTTSRSQRARGVAAAEVTLPPIRLRRCEAAAREPGTTLFNIRLGGAAAAERAIAGWLVAIDREGRIATVHQSRNGLRGVRWLANGNILTIMLDGLLVEMTPGGAIERQWYATGQYRNSTPPAGAIPIDVENIHHIVSETADGNMLLLSMEVRTALDWHGSTRDPMAPREPASLVGDVIVEFRPDGTKVREHRLFDILDPYRISYTSRSSYWWRRGYPDTYDWCHANGVIHNPSDDSIIVTLRTQDCIIKLDRLTGTLKWILGTPHGWREKWADKLLQPVGPILWPFHPHDPALTPTGTLTCFDNGNHRAMPFEPIYPNEQNYSRAVEYEIDDTARTVRQVWCWGNEPDERVFAGFQGGVLRLPQTGNTSVTFGGICTIGGVPYDEPDGADARARVVEVTPDRRIVLDLEIGEAKGELPHISVFRAAHTARELDLDWRPV